MHHVANGCNLIPPHSLALKPIYESVIDQCRPPMFDIQTGDSIICISVDPWLNLRNTWANITIAGSNIIIFCLRKRFIIPLADPDCKGTVLKTLAETFSEHVKTNYA